MGNTNTITVTPWGKPDSVQAIMEGVTQVETPSHGGLVLSADVWFSLPDVVTACMRHTGFAEEDCEMAIVLDLLGLGDKKTHAWALHCAHEMDTYGPALPYLTVLERNVQYMSEADMLRWAYISNARTNLVMRTILAKES